MGWNRLSLGVLPAIFLSVLLAFSWLAATVYSEVAELPMNDPFTTVWASFTVSGSLSIIITAIAGLLLSCAFPRKGGRASGVDIPGLSSRRRTWTFVALAAILLLVISKGSYLFQADNYLQFVLPQAMASLSNIAAPIGVLAAGIVCARQRVLGWILMAVLLACLFAYGTRLLAMAPLIFLLGQLLGGKRVSWRAWICGGLAAYWLLPVPLQTRSLPYHGLFPYADYMLSTKASSESGNVAVQLLGNIGFTAPIAEYTSSTVGQIPVAAMVASLNPLPENFTDWDVWAPQLRAHLFIPFSMIGEFSNFSLHALFIAMFLWGLVVRLSVNEALKNTSTLGRLVLISSVGLASISALYVTQYNTRSVSRIVSILVVLSLVSAIHRSLNRGTNAKIVSFNAGPERRFLYHASRAEYAPGPAAGRRVSSLGRWKHRQDSE